MWQNCASKLSEASARGKDYERKLTLIARKYATVDWQTNDRAHKIHLSPYSCLRWHNCTYARLWRILADDGKKGSHSDMIEFDVHVFNMTLSSGLNVFRLESEASEQSERKTHTMRLIERCQLKFLYQNWNWHLKGKPRAEVNLFYVLYIESQEQL